MTSFTKHRRQPTGKSLVRPKLKVTCLPESVPADLLPNSYVYFWSLKSGRRQKMIAESRRAGIVNRKQTTALSLWFFPSVLHPPMLLPSLQMSSRAQMWECRHAELQLAAPATTQSAFWNTAFLTVYCFLSRANLIWGSRGGGNHGSRRPTVPNSSGDRSGEMHEFHMRGRLGGVWHKSAFWKCWLNLIKATAEHRETHCFRCARQRLWSVCCGLVLLGRIFLCDPFFRNVRITLKTFWCNWRKGYAAPEMAARSGGVCSLDFTPCSISHTLAAWPLEEGVIIPAATQLLRYFYLPWNFTSVLPPGLLCEYVRAVVVYWIATRFLIKLSLHMHIFVLAKVAME